jgi:hypothetical protein
MLVEREALPVERERVIAEKETQLAERDRVIAALRRIGDEITEVLEYVPSSFTVMQHVRPKMSCRACETIVQVPLPSLPIERGRPIVVIFPMGSFAVGIGDPNVTWMGGRCRRCATCICFRP